MTETEVEVSINATFPNLQATLLYSQKDAAYLRLNSDRRSARKVSSRSNSSSRVSIWYGRVSYRAQPRN